MVSCLRIQEVLLSLNVCTMILYHMDLVKRRLISDFELYLIVTSNQFTEKDETLI